MAKVTVTFEDIEEGVSVNVESDPPFPGPAASKEEKESLTDAQQMGLRMTHLLTEEHASQNGFMESIFAHDDHDHDHDHDPEIPSDGATTVQPDE